MPLIKMTSSLESEIKKVSLLLPRNNCLGIQASCLDAIAFLTSTSSWCLMLLLLVGFLHKQYWSSLLDSQSYPSAFEAHTPSLVPKGPLNMPQIQSSGVDQILGKFFFFPGRVQSPWRSFLTSEPQSLSREHLNPPVREYKLEFQRWKPQLLSPLMLLCSLAILLRSYSEAISSHSRHFWEAFDL